MVNALDESILNISIALSDRGFMSSTVLIFTSLSGGAVGGMELSMGSNYPLRGSKMTLWEGGLRTVAFMVGDIIDDNCKFYNSNTVDLQFIRTPCNLKIRKYS